MPRTPQNLAGIDEGQVIQFEHLNDNSFAEEHFQRLLIVAMTGSFGSFSVL
jgi:hypothetical protein